MSASQPLTMLLFLLCVTYMPPSSSKDARQKPMPTATLSSNTNLTAPVPWREAYSAYRASTKVTKAYLGCVPARAGSQGTSEGSSQSRAWDCCCPSVSLAEHLSCKGHADQLTRLLELWYMQPCGVLGSRQHALQRPGAAEQAEGGLPGHAASAVPRQLHGITIR